MEKGEIDSRGSYDRAGYTETTCDECGEVILESEERFRDNDGRILCGECRPAPVTGGEWELEKTETDESMLYARDEKHRHTIRVIARVMHPDGSAEGVANAVLLREAKNLLGLLRKFDGILSRGWTGDEIEALQPEVASAIAKAEGKPRRSPA